MDELIRKQTILNMIDNLQFGDCGTATERLTKLYDAVENQPSVDAVEVVRCKDCKYRPISYGDEHDLCFPEEYHCPCQCDDNWYSWMPKDDFFCARGERRDDHDAHNPKGIHA